MSNFSFYLNAVTFGIIVLSWVAFGLFFLTKKRTPGGKSARREPISWLGIALQGVGFGLVWSMQRVPAFSPFLGESNAVSVLFDVVALALAAVSLYAAYSAINELGRQWSLQARVIEDHKLITSGVYGVVRHPIYSAMLGMLITTGLAISHPLVVLAAAAVFLIGTRIRTNAEERLLKASFPEEYAAYAARVPAIVPLPKMS